MQRLIIVLIMLFAFSLGLAPSASAETDEDNLAHKPKQEIPQKEIQEMENLRGDFMRWFDVQKDKRSHQFHDILELKLFQTNVFFGSILAFFAILAAFFVLKLIFNIACDALKAAYTGVLTMMGRETATVREHHFAPIMTSGSPGKAKAKNGGAQPAQAKKKFLFCEVMSQFVNPLISQETVQKALDEQGARNPKPRIGLVLIEQKAVSQNEVDKTLRLQQQFRAQK